MGLFDSLKKIKDSLNLSKNLFETLTTQSNQEISFDSLRKEMSSKSAGTKSPSNSVSNIEELYKSVLECLGWKETTVGDYRTIPNKKARLDDALPLAEQLYSSGDNRAFYLLVSIYMDKGVAEGKNYDKKCLELLKEGVTKHDVMSILSLGGAYADGRYGLKPDFSKGKEYIELAAQSGLPLAYVHYANICFAEGNIEQGMEYLEEAVNAGAPAAYLAMGDRYSIGDAVPKDVNKAMGYYKKAIELGCAEGFAKLGICYLANGDKKKAIKYFKQGSELGDPLSKYMYSPYTGDDSVGLKLLREVYPLGLSYCTVFSVNPTAPVYTYRCDMGNEFIEVKSQNPKCPEQKEVVEAYFVKYGKRLFLSKFDTAKYKRLN